MKKVIWTLNESDAEKILTLYEKKTALENLVKIVDASNEDMYKKLTVDYNEVIRLFNKWWRDMSSKYNWERSEGGNWSIDFSTKEVILAN